MWKLTMSAVFGLAAALQATAAGAFDAQGRLLIGTDQGIWRSHQRSHGTFFDGRFLSARDLTREQNYQIHRPPIRSLDAFTSP